MRKAALGEQEGELLKWVAEHAPVSVAEVVEGFGQARGLARTTMLTVMERLRRKGYLQRESQGGVFRYSPVEPHEKQLKQLVERFVEKSLGGSLQPFVAYLASDAKLSEEELKQLKAIVDELEPRDKSGEAQN